MSDQEAQWLNALLELEDGLSEWELEFVESISNMQRPLTDKQHDKLEAIYEKLC